MYYLKTKWIMFLTFHFLITFVICMKETKQNVLLILIDDLRHLLDEKHILPNIFRIAANGIHFKNAFAQQSLCAPSRNSLLTGRRPDSIHLYDFYSYWRDDINTNFTTLPQLFKENGYDTYSIGKVFHPGKSSNYTDDYPYSWSVPPFHPSTEIFKNAAVCRDEVTKKLQKNLICPVKVDTQPGNTLPDIESLDYAIDVLRKRRDEDKPLFLAVGFHKPHIPLKFPEEYLAKIPMSKVRPPTQPDIPERLPKVSWHPWTDVRSRDDIKRLNISFPYGIMPHDWTLRIRQSYYAAAMFVDHLVGVLLRAVDLRKTVVVLTSDHGWSLGENGLWAKYSNFDAALRVPLRILSPNLPHKIIYEPVELIDIFPTLIRLAGLPLKIPKCEGTTDKSRLCFEGKDLVNLLNSTQKERAFAISQYPRPSVKPQKNTDKPNLKHIKIMGYSMRTKKYRYTQWISFNNTNFKLNWNKVYGEELYDHMRDPDEADNLNFVPKYKYIKNKLSILLRSKIDPNMLKYQINEESIKSRAAPKVNAPIMDTIRL